MAAACSLRVEAYNAAIRACDRGNAWTKALLVFEDIEVRSLQPDGISYMATVASLSNGMRLADAIALYRAAVDLELLEGWRLLERWAVFDLHLHTIDASVVAL